MPIYGAEEALSEYQYLLTSISPLQLREIQPIRPVIYYTYNLMPESNKRLYVSVLRPSLIITVGEVDCF